ncbi:hypothetical protein EVS84_15795 [Pseudomonas koreensis]|uniref:Uncharacterized protein n=1 Tax=Pseudomonas koreensis TaxID=198620 RepID=A0A4Q4L5A7_9PSED|nr:hypothetical protein EVS84_15795 [Pseudomonas koreensis]
MRRSALTATPLTHTTWQAIQWSENSVGDYQSDAQRKASGKDLYLVSGVSAEWLTAAPSFAGKPAPTEGSVNMWERACSRRGQHWQRN